MKKAIKDAWLSGLRSGEYAQFRGALCEGHPEKMEYAKSFCCLGAGAVIKNKEDKIDDVLAHMYVTGGVGSYLGIDDDQITSKLIHMNDKEGKTFAEIADWIEANISTED